MINYLKLNLFIVIYHNIFYVNLQYKHIILYKFIININKKSKIYKYNIFIDNRINSIYTISKRVLQLLLNNCNTYILKI